VIASSIQPKAIEWLWPGFVPQGKITVVAGQMGQAKSLFTTWLAAGVSKRQRGAIILNAEDDPEDTIRPRLEAAGANLDLVWVEPGVEIDVQKLDRLIREMNAALVVIDPVTAFMGSQINSWKSQDVRRFGEPIRNLAAETGAAVLMVQHLNRRADAGDPLARIADSQGIPQLARSVLVWGPDPADPEGDQGSMKALTRAKGNLAKTRASATFTIVERVVDGWLHIPALERGDDRDISADDVVSDSEARTAQDEAVSWLLMQLADGPVSAKEITKRAREDGITERTLKRAKARAGVVSEQDRTANAITGWTWRLKSLDVHVKDDGPLGTSWPSWPSSPSKGAKSANDAKRYKEAATLSVVEATPDDEQRAADLEARYGEGVA